MRSSSTSSRGKFRLRAATAEPLTEDAPRFLWPSWKTARTHPKKDAVDMMFISLSIFGQRERKPPTAREYPPFQACGRLSRALKEYRFA
jgi:hypothetical protein